MWNTWAARLFFPSQSAIHIILKLTVWLIHDSITRKTAKEIPAYLKMWIFFFFFKLHFVCIYFGKYFLGLAWNSLGWLFNSSTQWRNALSQHVRKCEKKCWPAAFWKREQKEFEWKKRKRVFNVLCVHEVDIFGALKLPSSCMGYRKERNREKSFREMLRWYSRKTCFLKNKTKQKNIWLTRLGTKQTEGWRQYQNYTE